MILNTLRGTLKEDPINTSVFDGETFVEYNFRMHGTNDVPVKISEYMIPKDFSKRYELLGYLNSMSVGKYKNKQLHTFFEVLNITEIDETVKDKNNIIVSGRLTRDPLYRINYNAQPTLLCLIKYKNSRGKIALCNIKVKKSLARKFKDELKENDVIKVEGHVNSSEKGFIIEGETLEILQKGSVKNDQKDVEEN